MPDWQTRLQLDYQDPVTGNPVTITPIDSFAPVFAMTAEALHSIEQTHIGVIYSPQAVTFSLSVKAIGPIVGQLTALAMNRTRFDVTLHETNNGHDWSFVRVVLQNCVITSAQPTTATPSGAPQAVFSGISLSAVADLKDHTQAKIP